MASLTNIVTKLIRSPFKIPKLIGLISESYSSSARPSTWKKIFSAQEAHFATLAEKGVEYEKITVDHANPKIAGLAQALEEMLEHPLSKRFIKEKPDVYVTNTPPSGILEMFRAGSPGVATPKTILFPRQLIEIMGPAELKASLAHEMGHIIRADKHPIRAIGNLLQSQNQKMERSADQIGILLSGDAEAAKTSLQKIHKLAHDYASAGVEMLPKPLNRMMHPFMQAKDRASRMYPSIKQRGVLFERTAEQLAKDGESFAEKEIIRRIEAARHEARIPD